MAHKQSKKKNPNSMVDRLVGGSGWHAKVVKKTSHHQAPTFGGAGRCRTEIFLAPVGGVLGGAGRSQAEGENCLGTVGAWSPSGWLGGGFPRLTRKMG